MSKEILKEPTRPKIFKHRELGLSHLEKHVFNREEKWWVELDDELWSKGYDYFLKRGEDQAARDKCYIEYCNFLENTIKEKTKVASNHIHFTYKEMGVINNEYRELKRSNYIYLWGDAGVFIVLTVDYQDEKHDSLVFTGFKVLDKEKKKRLLRKVREFAMNKINGKKDCFITAIHDGEQL